MIWLRTGCFSHCTTTSQLIRGVCCTTDSTCYRPCLLSRLCPCLVQTKYDAASNSFAADTTAAVIEAVKGQPIQPSSPSPRACTPPPPTHTHTHTYLPQLCKTQCLTPCRFACCVPACCSCLLACPQTKYDAASNSFAADTTAAVIEAVKGAAAGGHGDGGPNEKQLKQLAMPFAKYKMDEAVKGGAQVGLQDCGSGGSWYTSLWQNRLYGTAC